MSKQINLFQVFLMKSMKLKKNMKMILTKIIEKKLIN